MRRIAALDATGDASLDSFLADMHSYRVVYLCPARDLRAAGFEFLATAKRPRYTLRTQSGGTLDVVRLLDSLGVPQENPFHSRRKAWPRERRT